MKIYKFGNVRSYINNIRYDHCRDADFRIHRPDGSGDNLLLFKKLCNFHIFLNFVFSAFMLGDHRHKRNK